MKRKSVMTDEQQFARFTGQQLKRYFAYHSSRRKYVLRMHYAAFTLRCIASCMHDALHPACRMHGVNTPYASCNNTPYYAVLRRMHPAMHTPHASRNAGVDEICCFNTITACGGRWDGQTDRHIAIAFSALCIASRGNY